VFPGHERGQQGGTGDQRGDDEPVIPAALRDLDHPVHEADQADRGQDGAEEVDPGRRGVLRLRYQQRDRDQGEQHDGYVDQEHRAPPEVAQQVPADDRAEWHADAHPDRRVRYRLGALVRWEDHG
jgi:hypothetical protein